MVKVKQTGLSKDPLDHKPNVSGTKTIYGRSAPTCQKCAYETDFFLLTCRAGFIDVATLFQDLIVAVNNPWRTWRDFAARR